MRVEFVCGIIFVASAVAASADDAIFDLAALSSTPLNPRVTKSEEHDGIVTEEVRFHSEIDGDKDVDIFAYFSYPKGGNQLPAFIWNPGGLGQASRGYTETPAKRGYAVLCIDFPQPGYRSTGDYPINRGLYVGDDPKHSAIYHGAVALIKAVSFLESRPEVDPARIGMAGASWGGFFTTLMIGIDTRLKCGSCLYGTGSLQLGNAWWDGVSQSGPPPSDEQRERWRVTLDPAWRLPERKTPIGWITTTNDAFYSMPAIMQTLQMCRGPTHLTLIPNWDHAMPPQYTNEHVFDWLDVHLRAQPAFTKVGPIRVETESDSAVAVWDFVGDTTSADLIVSYGESGNWRHRFWHTYPAEIRDKQCRAKFPAAKLPCFISGAAIDKRGIRSSTLLLRVETDKLGLKSTQPCPDFNGCQEWGGFEESNIEFLQRHNQGGQTRWLPKLSPVAKEGKQSAIVELEQTTLPPILSVATVPHRLSCWFKAENPTKISLQLGGETREFMIGADWTEATMNLTPANTTMGAIGAVINNPTKSSILVDAIAFRPILE